ncbi:MAG: asparagine synthase-related protein, partial [Pseudomonadota bacterium]
LRRFLAEDRLAVNHLRRWDHGALAHGLEVRLPYLSRPITEIAEGLTWEALVRGNDGQPVPGKAPLRAAARRLLPEVLWRSLTERAKVSAPSALANARAALNARCREWMPMGHRERHPLAACALDEVSLMSVDLFAALYLLEADGLPFERAAKLLAARLYVEHGDALDDYWCRYASAIDKPTTTRHRRSTQKRGELYDRWTRGADRYASAALNLTTYTASNALLAKVADLRPGMAVIDLACGTGATSRAAFAVQPALARVFAVDWSAPMLDEARGVLAGLPVLFQQAPAGALAPALGPHLGEDRVQRVLCNAALFQFPDYEGVLADLRLLLDDDGRFAFTVPMPTQGPTIGGVLDRCGLYPLGRPFGSPPTDSASRPVLGPPSPSNSDRSPPPQPNFDERVAATEAAGWRVLDSQVCTIEPPIEEHVRWLMLPMFRHPSWNNLPEDELQSRLTEALRRESSRYSAAWRAIVIAPS